MSKQKTASSKKVKTKPSEYKDSIFKDGFFNPICPLGFNFLTGFTEFKPDREIRRLSCSMSGRLNGRPVHNF